MKVVLVIPMKAGIHCVAGIPDQQTGWVSFQRGNDDKGFPATVGLRDLWDVPAKPQLSSLGVSSTLH